jgi:phosphocarrier protein
MSSPAADGPPAVTRSLTMVNRRGLHARAAAKFVQTAGGFEADITVAKDGQTVDGRSIMGLLMLAGVNGSTIVVTARGAEAVAAVDALAALVASGFGETD